MGDLWVKVFEDPSSLSSVEAFKLGEWATAAMWARQNEFIQFQEKLIDESVWIGCRGILESSFAIPWMHTWWQSYDKSVFSDDFVALVDEVASNRANYDYNTYVRQISGDSPGR